MPSKYTTIQKKEVVRPYTIHPVWRGIGCIMMLIIPVMAWVSAMLLADFGWTQGWPVMRELSGYIKFPEITYQIPGISVLANRISSVAGLKAVLLFFFGILLVYSGVMSFVYAVVWRVIGPPRYSPIDAPAPKTRVKRYTR